MPIPSGYTSGQVVQAVVGVGKVLQVVSTTKTDGFSTTSSSYVDVTGMSVTITPTSSTSTILVMTGLALSAGSTTRALTQLVRGSTNIAISTGFTNNQTSTGYEPLYQTQYISINHIDSPATTSATTYKFQLKTGGTGTAYVNTQGGNTDFGNVSTLTVMEISA